ncbi:BQ2448_5592 [Microbotryum intermedium]|uniref:BQ2448_5592 protein n=1 Tax=Microbotryum intermedium TaxID=269621 RepID=A0A238F772_9BASI|nr:BQ2448_5592 [Microbotryum intermedium]
MRCNSRRVALGAYKLARRSSELSFLVAVASLISGAPPLMLSSLRPLPLGLELVPDHTSPQSCSTVEQDQSADATRALEAADDVNASAEETAQPRREGCTPTGLDRSTHLLDGPTIDKRDHKSDLLGEDDLGLNLESIPSLDYLSLEDDPHGDHRSTHSSTSSRRSNATLFSTSFEASDELAGSNDSSFALARSRLAPTARPFVFVPKAHFRGQDAAGEEHRPRERAALLPTTAPSTLQPASEPRQSHQALTPLTVDLSTHKLNLRFVEPRPKPDLQGVEQWRKLTAADQTANTWSFDEVRRLRNEGARYNIADEILRLQSQVDQESSTLEPAADPTWRSPSHELQSRPWPTETVWSEPSSASSFDRPVLLPSFPRGLSPLSSSSGASSHRHHNSSPENGLANLPRPVRTRNSSLGSSYAYITPGMFREASTYVAPVDPELERLRGPSHAPGSAQHIASLESTPGPVLTRARARSMASPAPELVIHDALYLETRNTFVRQALINRGLPATLANQESMIALFDQAMRSESPSSILYDLNEPPGISPSDRFSAEHRRASADVVASHSWRLSLNEGQGGPHSGNRKHGLYKTELCRGWEEKGSCRYGSKCQFAHGVEDLRYLNRHPKFKSEICRTFWLHGSCPYGRRCCFIHTTVPPESALHKQSSAASPSSSASPAGYFPGNDSSTSTSMDLGDPSKQEARTGNSMPSIASLGFGPALSSYLAPSVTTSAPLPKPNTKGVDQDGGAMWSELGLDSKVISPLESRLSGHSKHSSDPISSVGLGIRTPNPSEVPPTFQSPPRSRLQRLASFPSSASSSVARTQSDDILSRPAEPPARSNVYGPPNGFLHSRQGSLSSVASFNSSCSGSSSSSFASLAQNSSLRGPSLPRTKSFGSLDLFPQEVTGLSLQRVGGSWLGDAGLNERVGTLKSNGASSSHGQALDWEG